MRPRPFGSRGDNSTSVVRHMISDNFKIRPLVRAQSAICRAESRSDSLLPDRKTLQLTYPADLHSGLMHANTVAQRLTQRIEADLEGVARLRLDAIGE